MTLGYSKPYDPTLAAKATLYNGVIYKSKSEARCARWLDLLGYYHIYEPNTFNLGDNIFYQPDFLIPSDENHFNNDLYIEVKGGWHTIRQIDREKIERFGRTHNLYVVGGICENKETIWNDYERSGGIMYSNRFLHDPYRIKPIEPLECCVLPRDICEDSLTFLPWNRLIPIPSPEAYYHAAHDKDCYSELSPM